VGYRVQNVTEYVPLFSFLYPAAPRKNLQAENIKVRTLFFSTNWGKMNVRYEFIRQLRPQAAKNGISREFGKKLIWRPCGG